MFEKLFIFVVVSKDLQLDMTLCFAADCNHKNIKDSCHFYSFPRDKKEWKKWRDLSRRADREPPYHAKLCSCHFVDGKKENGPTIFKYNEKRAEFLSPEKNKNLRRRKVMRCLEAEESSEIGSSTLTNENPTTYLPVGSYTSKKPSQNKVTIVDPLSMVDFIKEECTSETLKLEVPTTDPLLMVNFIKEECISDTSPSEARLMTEIIKEKYIRDTSRSRAARAIDPLFIAYTIKREHDY